MKKIFKACSFIIIWHDLNKDGTCTKQKKEKTKKDGINKSDFISNVMTTCVQVNQRRVFSFSCNQVQQRLIGIITSQGSCDLTSDRLGLYISTNDGQSFSCRKILQSDFRKKRKKGRENLSHEGFAGDITMTIWPMFCFIPN